MIVVIINNGVVCGRLFIIITYFNCSGKFERSSYN